MKQILAISAFVFSNCNGQPAFIPLETTTTTPIPYNLIGNQQPPNQQPPPQTHPVWPQPSTTANQGLPPLPVLPVVPVQPATTAAAASSTAAAVPTIPSGYEFGAYGQLCSMTGNVDRYKCRYPTDVATDTNGFLMCERANSCCMCASIECGFGAEKCQEISFGTKSAMNVGNIAVAGSTQFGAVIGCSGQDSCKGATITGDNVVAIDCDGSGSCQGAKFLITDPHPQFAIECAGVSACEGLEIEVRFSGPPPGYMCAHDANPAVPKLLFEIGGIECASENACAGIDITINNGGCRTVEIGIIECLGTNACDRATFDLIGDVTILQCACGTGTSCGTAIGLETCFTPTLPAAPVTPVAPVSGVFV